MGQGIDSAQCIEPAGRFTLTRRFRGDLPYQAGGGERRAFLRHDRDRMSWNNAIRVPLSWLMAVVFDER
ncbi:MAG: hypothetical protein ACK4P4_07610 [Allorhizobium sp.]